MLGIYIKCLSKQGEKTVVEPFIEPRDSEGAPRECTVR